jgi:hypothetical protein
MQRQAHLQQVRMRVQQQVQHGAKAHHFCHARVRSAARRRHRDGGGGGGGDAVVVGGCACCAHTHARHDVPVRLALAALPFHLPRAHTRVGSSAELLSVSVGGEDMRREVCGSGDCERAQVSQWRREQSVQLLAAAWRINESDAAMTVPSLLRHALLNSLTQRRNPLAAPICLAAHALIVTTYFHTCSMHTFAESTHTQEVARAVPLPAPPTAPQASWPAPSERACVPKQLTSGHPFKHSHSPQHHHLTLPSSVCSLDAQPSLTANTMASTQQCRNSTAPAPAPPAAP